MTEERESDRAELLACLQYQRDSVLSIVSGLAEEAWHKPVVPSGWTVAGLVAHLGGAERHWFQQVLTGVCPDLPFDEGLPPYDPEAPFTCDRPPADVIAYYREVCAVSDANLAGVLLPAAPRGQHGDPEFEPASVRAIVLHMIEETAAHSGHLEVARELIDGRTNLGLR
jgi:uncharacterized damage-inducible protein DinB